MNTMQPSQNGYSCLRYNEGFRAKVYKDLNGIETIGYGHKVLPGEVFGLLSPFDGASLLEKDAKKACDCINNNVTSPLNQNQFDALLSLVYNIGCGNFLGSQVLHFVNIGQMDKAANAFRNWHRPNLGPRREREILLFNTKPNTEVL